MNMKGRKLVTLLSLCLAACASWSVLAFAEGTEKPSVVSNLSAKIYGYVRCDLAYDTARIFTGNYALWVKSGSTNRSNDAGLNLTANQTRLGLGLSGPEVAGARSSGIIEFDFYGGGVENKSLLMMRHAYLELYWPENDLGILAGQTWDVLSPLAPDTVNFLPLSMAGRLGYRRPQLRLTQGIGVGEKAKIVVKAAASREISETLTGLTYKEGPYPALQGSIAFNAPLLTSQPAHIGVSGVWGKEQYDGGPAGWIDLPVHALSVDLALPLIDGLAVKANAWKGTNLDAFLGGVLQGVNAATLETINAQGAWACLNIVPASDWKFNAGASIDIPQGAQLAAGMRSQNACGFVNAFYTVTAPFQVGLEVSYWETMYKDDQIGTALRYQTAAIYSF